MSWEEIINQAKERGHFTQEEVEASLSCFDCSCDNENPTRIFRTAPDGPKDTWLYCWSIDFYLAVKRNDFNAALEITAQILSRRFLISPFIGDALLLEEEALPLEC